MRILTTTALDNIKIAVKRTHPEGVKYNTERVLIHPDHVDCTRLHIYDTTKDYGVVISEDIGFIRIEISNLSAPKGKRCRRDLLGLSERVVLKPDGESEGLSRIAESIYKRLSIAPMDARVLSHLIANIYPGKFEHFTDLKFKKDKGVKHFEYVDGKLIPTNGVK